MADQIRQVRLLIPDVDAIYGEDGDETMFTDDDITDFIELGNGNSKYAAGLAKITVGSSEAMILKVITNYEEKTDGASLAKQWLAMGARLIDEGKQEIINGSGDLDYFDIISPVTAVAPEGYQGEPGIAKWL
jgi:hypothetical protein